MSGIFFAFGRNALQLQESSSNTPVSVCCSSAFGDFILGYIFHLLKIK